MLGPPSVLFIKGARIKRIPPQFKVLSFFLSSFLSSFLSPSFFINDIN